MGNFGGPAVAAALVIALSGCATMRPVPQALNGNGPVGQDSGQGPVSIFKVSYANAFKINSDAAAAGAPLVEPTASQDAYKRMSADGFAVVNSNCADFFEKAGEEEKWLNFGLDAVPVGAAIATGVLALSNPGTAIPGAIVTLVTSTTTSGVKAYQKDFLFAPENIADVRGLVADALNSHYKAVFEPPSSQPQVQWTFAGAVSAIRDHQAICRASNMVSLVTQSIKKSSTQSSSPDSGSAPTPAPAPASPAVTISGTAATTVTPTTSTAPNGTPMTTSTHKNTKVKDSRQ